MLVSLAQLQRKSVFIDELQVHSIGCHAYMVRVCLGDQWFMVADRRGPLRFNSIDAIRSRLARLRVGKATQLHRCPQEEMTGFNAAAQWMQIPLMWNTGT